MKTCLLIDFGSTYTKLTAVDLEHATLLGTASSFTTVTTDIKEGYHQALANLYQNMNKEIAFDKIIACSSAAGGLKMAAIGLVEELTVEAARLVCLGAGAKVDLVFSHHITNADVQRMKDKKIDIILLAGGTDGGNSECVLFNIRKLGKANVKIPIIYAGNRSCQDEVAETMNEYDLNGFICDNIMAKLNVLTIEDAKRAIRNIFLENIIVAKGIKAIEAEIDQVILPTPQAVLLAAELLAKGYLHEPGLGDLLIFDIGGATTDVYSVCSGSPKRSDVILKGFEEPFAKRSVEGDLGMRYSALGILEMLSEEQRQLILEGGIDINKECQMRHNQVSFLPTTEHDLKVEEMMGKICVDSSLSRHVGKLETYYTAMGAMYTQTGKDLSDVRFVIGTGGVLANHPQAYNILHQAVKTPKDLFELRPTNPQFMIDIDYLLSAMGLLSTFAPEVALKIMKEHLKMIEESNVWN